jgi:hypothetical protein
VDPNDNFFDLGGDSLLLVAIHSDLQKIFKTQIPITDLFEFATVRRLASHLGIEQTTTSFLLPLERQAHKQRGAFARFRADHLDGEL